VAEASIPVDLFNPGQVFACIGLVEAADILLDGAEGMFEWSDASAPRFHVRVNGTTSPVRRVLQFLDQAKATAAAPVGSNTLDGWKNSWGPSPSLIERGRGYPFPDPASPATLVCILSDGTHSISLEHWGEDATLTQRDNVKFWAGAGGYPGSALARDALNLVQGRAEDAADDPFALGTPQSSSFRFDWRRDYIAIHSGFSLNDHSDIVTIGFPLVELLAAIGLTHARPKRPNRRDKLTYEYAVVGREHVKAPTWFPPNILRAALGAAPLPFPTRQFQMLLDWPGQEGQARSITTVIEETET